MLNSFFFSFNFHRFCQSGLFLDFFVKKIAEIFVKNIFIYTSQFFGEKYMIEELTRKIFERFLFKTNKFLISTKLSYSLFFTQIISFFFYLIFLFILLF